MNKPQYYSDKFIKDMAAMAERMRRTPVAPVWLIRKQEREEGSMKHRVLFTRGDQ